MANLTYKNYQGAYPRDLVGYGRDVPHAQWPNGARVAVQFVINYEEGGENCLLHGDGQSEAFLSEIVGAAQWPGQRHMNMESIYEYGSRAGFWRLHRMFTDRKMPVTVYGVATAMARHTDAVKAMVDAGWEMATHGYKWIEYKDYARADEEAHIHAAIKLHTELVGSRPLGFYQGRCSLNTTDIVMQEGGFLYTADSYADDLPYWLNGPKGPQLVVPYTLDANDMRFATPQGFNAGDQFYSYLKDSFDVLYAEGAERPKMLSVGLHCRLIGRPGRAAALARFLDYVKSHDKAWVPTRLDIARHWIKTHAPQGGYRPSHMPRGLFVERFGDIFEHTPKVAETAHWNGFTTADDTADGLSRAMTRAMRTLNDQEKLALIKAHPDLAGRLALAKQLTADSTREQAGAGLDRLTPDELKRFQDLNTAYTTRFGFPFIFAVKGKTKADILASFEERLRNDRTQEFETALQQIERIASLRIADRLGATG
jgi:OHCU decarboxylase